jgi:hypothetical protein
MKKFRVKKKNKFLYQGYKESKMLSENGFKDKSNLRYSPKGAIQDKRDKKLTKIPIPKTTQIIAVACLDNECGCSYITQALANYIRTKVNNSICIVDASEKGNKNYKQMVAIKSVDICNLHSDYKYILVDMGNLKERSDTEKLEYKRANIKIMISNLEDYYLRQLAAYIKEDKKSAMKCSYVFNLVPQEQKRKVHTLMEAYEHYSLPVIDKDNLGYDTKKIFNNILLRRRGK